MTSHPIRPETSDREASGHPDDVTRVDEGGRHAGSRPVDDATRTGDDAVYADDPSRTGEDLRYADDPRTAGDAAYTDDDRRTEDDVRYADDARLSDGDADRDMRTTGDVDTSYRSGSPSDQVAAASGSSNGSTALLGEHRDLSDRWDRVQATFVDDPRQAVADAAGLVEDTLSRLSDTFARERARGEGAGSDESGTEDLRQAMQRYREFFRRLLAA